MTVPDQHAIEEGAFQVDFQSLIKVLGENLYANPKAAVRELIQNASDSCVRRSTAQQHQHPQIQVRTHPDERLLIFEDNGAGMTHSDVRQYLASIGGGRTRRERSRLSTEDPEAARMLIGQFGIGFLSTFVIADMVTVDTCSIEGDTPLRWVCEGTTEYQISPGERRDPGTRVTLALKPSHYDLLDEETLRQAIVHYADFIAFPILLNQHTTPVNRMHAPWHHHNSTTADYTDYLRHRYHITPLALEPVALEHPDLALQGVLFIPPRSAEWKRRLRSIDIFQKRMFVNEDLNILPEWAGFISGVLDCPTLDLVASRETAISERPSYRALQDYLGEAVTTFMRRLAQHERSTFQEVINQHDWPVKWGAIRNDFFFDQVKDLIPIRSDSGALVLPRYLERVPQRLGGMKTIYYVSTDQPLGQQQSSVFRAQGVPVFRVDMVDEQFLKKYAERSDNVTLRQMVSGIVELMESAEGQQWRSLEAHYHALGIVARAVRFHPPDVAAMVVKQAEYSEERLVEQVLDGQHSLGAFLGRVGKERSDAYGLCFNTDNPMLQRLARYQGSDHVRTIALQAIHASALLAAGVELTPDLSQRVAHAQMEIITMLLEQGEHIGGSQPAPPPAAWESEYPARPDYAREAEYMAPPYDPDPAPTPAAHRSEHDEPAAKPENLFSRMVKRFTK